VYPVARKKESRWTSLTLANLRDLCGLSQDFDLSCVSYVPAQPRSDLKPAETDYHISMPPGFFQAYHIPDSLPCYPKDSLQQEPSNFFWQSFDSQFNDSYSFRPSLSPFSIDQQVIDKSDYSLTSDNLLQIYHDVLEHNLSCWLTVMTCPYYLGPRDTRLLGSELGSSWSNRIYQRTIKLDRVARSCKLVNLTHGEDQAVSKALRLAIMAFAAQWAQGSSRH